MGRRAAARPQNGRAGARGEMRSVAQLRWATGAHAQEEEPGRRRNFDWRTIQSWQVPAAYRSQRLMPDRSVMTS